MILKGHINNIEDVKRLSKVASEQNFEVFISSDNTMFDARSLMALCTLIGKDVNIIVEDDIDEKLFAKVVKKMGI